MVKVTQYSSNKALLNALIARFDEANVDIVSENTTEAQFTRLLHQSPLDLFPVTQQMLNDLDRCEIPSSIREKLQNAKDGLEANQALMANDEKFKSIAELDPTKSWRKQWNLIVKNTFDFFYSIDDDSQKFYIDLLFEKACEKLGITLKPNSEEYNACKNTFIRAYIASLSLTLSTSFKTGSFSDNFYSRLFTDLGNSTKGRTSDKNVFDNLMIYLSSVKPVEHLRAGNTTNIYTDLTYPHFPVAVDIDPTSTPSIPKDLTGLTNQSIAKTLTLNQLDPQNFWRNLWQEKVDIILHFLYLNEENGKPYIFHIIDKSMARPSGMTDEVFYKTYETEVVRSYLAEYAGLSSGNLIAFYRAKHTKEPNTDATNNNSLAAFFEQSQNNNNDEFEETFYKIIFDRLLEESSNEKNVKQTIDVFFENRIKNDLKAKNYASAISTKALRLSIDSPTNTNLEDLDETDNLPVALSTDDDLADDADDLSIITIKKDTPTPSNQTIDKKFYYQKITSHNSYVSNKKAIIDGINRFLNKDKFAADILNIANSPKKSHFQWRDTLSKLIITCCYRTFSAETTEGIRNDTILTQGFTDTSITPETLRRAVTLDVLHEFHLINTYNHEYIDQMEFGVSIYAHEQKEEIIDILRKFSKLGEVTITLNNNNKYVVEMISSPKSETTDASNQHNDESNQEEIVSENSNDSSESKKNQITTGDINEQKRLAVYQITEDMVEEVNKAYANNEPLSSKEKGELFIKIVAAASNALKKNESKNAKALLTHRDGDIKRKFGDLYDSLKEIFKSLGTLLRNSGDNKKSEGVAEEIKTEKNNTTAPTTLMYDEKIRKNEKGELVRLTKTAATLQDVTEKLSKHLGSTPA